jgi:GNAT superfamily N-acetyltransferase
MRTVVFFLKTLLRLYKRVGRAIFGNNAVNALVIKLATMTGEMGSHKRQQIHLQASQPMDLRTIRRDDISAIADLMRQSPWRVFCRGICVPCHDLNEDDVREAFEQGVIEEAWSMAAEIDGELVGFVAAARRDEQVDLFLFEARRDERFVATMEAMLAALQQKARDAGINRIEILPKQPLSTTVDFKDDALIDVVFKMGFWHVAVVAAEMRIDLAGYAPPSNVAKRERALATNGVIVRPCTDADMPALLRLWEPKDAPYVTWRRLVMDVVQQVGPRYVVLAMHDSNVVGYATFFARTIHSVLPEYGPVWIAESHRGRGLSSVLMAKALRQIADLGIATQVQLSCYPNKFPVYTRQGYHFTQKYLFHMQWNR